MIMALSIAAYLLLSAAIGGWSRTKGLGFWRGFLFSLLFTPIGGSVMVGRARATKGIKRVIQTPEGPKTYCPYCASMVLVRAEACWHCGKNFRQQALRDFLTYGWISLLAIGCIVIVIALFGRNAVLKQDFRVKQRMDVVGAPIPKSDLELIDCSLDEEKTELQGSVKNNTTNDYEYVRLLFVLFDNEKNPIDTIAIENEALRSDSTWRFTYTDLDENVDHVALLRIEGW
jgi:hypothetical protein